MQAAQQQQTSRSILAGIAITLLLILGVVASWLVPLPMLYYRSKLGRKSSLIIPAAVILMLLVLSRGLSAWILMTSGFMVLGFLIYECFELRLTIEKTIVYSSMVVMAAGCLVLIFYSNVSQAGIYELAYQQTEAVAAQFVDAGLISEAPKEAIHLATLSLPGIAASMILFISWINLVLAIPLLKRNRLYVPDFGPLDRWKAPEPLVWGVIAGFAGVLSGLPGLSVLGLNLLCVLAPIYFFQGMSVISFFVNKIKIPLGFKALLYWLVFFQIPVNALVTGIGFFDVWANFRDRLFKKKEPDD